MIQLSPGSEDNIFLTREIGIVKNIYIDRYIACIEVVQVDSCDAYLEYIKSDAIKHLINQIYSPSSEIKKSEQSPVPHDDKYQEMVQKIDGM